MDDGQALMAQFEAGQQALQNMEAQLTRLEEQSIELRRALSTIEAVQAGAESALIPIGGGVHVRASIPAGVSFVTPVGAGYAADVDAEAAQQRLRERLAAAEKAFQGRSAEAEKLASQVRAIATQLQSQSDAPA
jgi:prefoldin alpha subunit